MGDEILRQAHAAVFVGRQQLRVGENRKRLVVMGRREERIHLRLLAMEELQHVVAETFERVFQIDGQT